MKRLSAEELAELKKRKCSCCGRFRKASELFEQEEVWLEQYLPYLECIHCMSPREAHRVEVALRARDTKAP